MKNAFNSILLLTLVGIGALACGAMYFGAPLFGWIIMAAIFVVFLAEQFMSMAAARKISAEEEQIAALKEAEKRLYEAVNELFGGDFAGAFFGKVNPFSPVNGSFYCEEALRSVGEFISQQFDAETAKFAERVSKYTNRAKRRAEKKK